MRSIWKGHIRFLLVAIPVRIYNAIETSEKIQFNQLHRDDFGPIGYDKRCKKCNEVVTNDQITKGYQYEPDRYAIVEPDDISKIKIKTTKAVDIVGFVDRDEIPSTFYDSPYFAGPDGAVSEKPYALLREVMKQTGKIAVGKVVLRDREDLVAVFPHEDGLVLQKLHYPHELRKMEDVPDLENVQKLDAQKLNKNELKLATTLVQEMDTTQIAEAQLSARAAQDGRCARPRERAETRCTETEQERIETGHDARAGDGHDSDRRSSTIRTSCARWKMCPTSRTCRNSMHRN